MEHNKKQELVDELFTEIISELKPDEHLHKQIHDFVYILIGLCLEYEDANVENLTKKIEGEAIYENINRIINFDRYFLRSFIMRIKEEEGTLWVKAKSKKHRQRR